MRQPLARMEIGRHGWIGLVCFALMGTACSERTDGEAGNPPDSTAAIAAGAGPVGQPNCETGTGFKSFSAVRQMVGEKTNVPEYHDCQSFPVRQGKNLVYGPVVKIYALPGIENLRDVDFQTQLPGVKVAVIDFEAGATGNYFAALGIRPEVTAGNCLYLRWDTAEQVPARQWKAAMGECTANPALYVTDYTVNYAPSQDPLPGAATWEIGDRPGNSLDAPYIGIACGQAWCEIARGNVVKKANKCRDNRPTVFCDTQPLAVSSGPGQPLRPEPGLMGTIQARPRIDTLEVNHFECDDCGPDEKWVALADIHLTDAQDGNLQAIYRRKLGLEPTSSSTSNVVSIRQKFDSTSPLGRWQARITAPNGSVTYRKVIRTDHPGVTIPGTARWAWSPKDEGGWVRCGNGCCSISDGVDNP